MTSIWLQKGEIIKKYNNSYQRTIEIKSVDVKSKAYINFNKENNYKDLKFTVSDGVRIWKYKNIFVKGCIPNWPEEVFVFEKVNNTLLWTYLTEDLNDVEIIGTFYKKRVTKNKSKNFLDNKNKEKR